MTIDRRPGLLRACGTRAHRPTGLAPPPILQIDGHSRPDLRLKQS
ncbi:MAG: hypothetical protein ACSLE9_10200 [Burkholderiaceae bacterium]